VENLQIEIKTKKIKNQKSSEQLRWPMATTSSQELDVWGQRAPYVWVTIFIDGN
jgi:hypothetical protein